MKNYLSNVWKKKLIKTKHFFSTKNIKVKKDLPKIVKDSIIKDSKLAKQLAEKFNLKLQLELVKDINLKSIRSYYKWNSIKKVWIFKNNNKSKSLHIPSLKDRILQKIVRLAILPIVEYQTDSNSFGFKEKRNAHQAVSIIANALVKFSKVKKLTKRFIPKKVCAKVYKKTTGRKFVLKNGNTKEFKKSKKQYNKVYYIFFFKFQNINNKEYIQYNNYLNVNIASCFDNISYESILELIPIANKYLFLLKAWLKLPIVGPDTINSKAIIRYKSLAGVPQEFTMRSTVYHIILDGLEKTLYKICLNEFYYQYNREQQKFAKQKMNIENVIIECETSVLCIRYANDIFIGRVLARNLSSFKKSKCFWTIFITGYITQKAVI